MCSSRQQISTRVRDLDMVLCPLFSFLQLFLRGAQVTVGADVRWMSRWWAGDVTSAHLDGMKQLTVSHTFQRVPVFP